MGADGKVGRRDVQSFASYPYARLSLVSVFLSSMELDRYPCPRRRDQHGRWRMLIGHVSTSCASRYGSITRKIGSLAKNTTPPRMARTSRASFSYRNSPDRRFDEERPCAEARIAVPGRIRPCQLSRGFRTAYWWGRIPNIVVVRCEQSIFVAGRRYAEPSRRATFLRPLGSLLLDEDQRSYPSRLIVE